MFDALARWIAAGGGGLAAFYAVVVALVATVALPKAIKHRVRPVLWMALAGALVEVPALSGIWQPAWPMLRAVSWSLVGWAVMRLAVVLGFDVLYPRLRGRPVHQLLRDVLQTALYVVATLVALRAAGVGVQGLVAGGTVVTAIVGLALQETLGNLAAGVALQFDRSLDVGDWIRLDKGELVGRVVSMDWRVVVVQTDDRSQVVVPNGVFTKTPFVNFSRPGGLTRRSVYVTVGPDVPPLHVHEALVQACRECPEVLTDPAPSVITQEFTDRGVNYWLRFFIADYARRDPVTSAVTTRVWYELNRRKIELALPRRVTFMHKVNERYEARALDEKIRDRRAAVECVDFMRELSESSREVLAREGRRLLFAPDEVILEAGHTGRAFYIVRRGEVLVLDGDVELARLGKGEFFGEMALLTGQPRRATVRAVGEVEVFEIDESLFARVLRAEPKVAERIGAVVGARQAKMEARRTGDRPSVEDVHSRAGEILSGIKRLFGLE
jgi:small-conductance mechanosensitive channel